MSYIPYLHIIEPIWLKDIVKNDLKEYLENKDY